VKLFLALWAALVLAGLAHIAVFAVLGPSMWLESLGNSFSPVGNFAFLIILALFVGRSRRIKAVSFGSALIVAGFIATVLALVYFGLWLTQISMPAGLVLVGAIGAIGYYPPGADMPFEYGARLWAASALLLSGAGLLLGAALQRFLARSAKTD